MSERNGPRGFPSWDELYRAQEAPEMPWYFEELDPDVARALGRHALVGGSALDVGTGPGTQAIALAKHGWRATGTDLSAAAVEKAAARAKAAGVDVTFVQDDVLESRLDARFDLVLDRGCFHVIAPERRADYVRSLERWVAPGGFLFLKCFSHLQPGTQGPYRFTEEQLRELFGAAFDVLSIEETVYQGTLDPLPRALFAVMSG